MNNFYVVMRLGVVMTALMIKRLGRRYCFLDHTKHF